MHFFILWWFTSVWAILLFLANDGDLQLDTFNTFWKRLLVPVLFLLFPVVLPIYALVVGIRWIIYGEEEPEVIFINAPEPVQEHHGSLFSVQVIEEDEVK